MHYFIIFPFSKEQAHQPHVWCCQLQQSPFHWQRTQLSNPTEKNIHLFNFSDVSFRFGERQTVTLAPAFSKETPLISGVLEEISTIPQTVLKSNYVIKISINISHQNLPRPNFMSYTYRHSFCFLCFVFLKELQFICSLKHNWAFQEMKSPEKNNLWEIKCSSMVSPILFIVEVTKPKAKTLNEASEPMELALLLLE